MTSELAQQFFSKNTFLKSGDQAEKNEACLSFLEEIFTKSVHRGGVREMKKKHPGEKRNKKRIKKSWRKSNVRGKKAAVRIHLIRFCWDRIEPLYM